jgi:hypothetical protein
MYNKGWIDDKLRKYMTPNNTRCGQVKENPNMHKNMPVCTSIRSIGHPTEKIAEVAEK